MINVNEIPVTRINNNVNGNPRYVIHFLSIFNEEELKHINSMELRDINSEYIIAINKARKFGGKKFHNKSFGGGIVFVSYNIREDLKKVLEFNFFN